MTSCSDGFNQFKIHHITQQSKLLLGESSTLDELFLCRKLNLEGTQTIAYQPLHNERSSSSNGDEATAFICNEETKEFQPSSAETDIFRTGPSCYQVSISSVFVISLICLLVVACRHYIRNLLLWLEETEPAISCTIFLVLFTVVSFPMAWGYMLLMVAAGYLYGILYGPLVVVTCGGIGILVAHLVMKNCCKNCIMKRFYNDKMEAVIRVVESGQGFRVVALSRLTPIPFGLQNGLFALTNIHLLTYIASSILGLVPTSILNCYMGTTVRSMEDVLSDDSNKTTGYIIFIVQILITFLLLWFVVRKGRMELKRAVEGEEKPEFIPLTEIKDDSS
ncbi:transmembrane protein 64-like [Mizuhopecten yessoensis]|uniref:Transmembrane protein 64 n=1 Tax=Mizuhopecten yessoensis TaxID=6573 RepID=A0A210QMD2_MIZYE|nr:transmembrane protein 64-like [Mizuhopecten yessoensis]OWF49885.1 Transmembrane protein 64 [Mizuhopecten yessoensis]